MSLALAALVQLYSDSGSNPDPIWLGTRTFKIESTHATYPNEWVHGRLNGDAEFSRQARCPFWTEPRNSSAGGVLEAINADGGLDWMLNYQDAGGTVELWQGEFGQDFSTWQQVASAKIQRIETRGENWLRITLADVADNLNEPIAKTRYDSADVPNNASLVERPQPVLLGAAKSIPAHAIDPTTLKYRVSDLSATIVQALDNGTGVVFTDNTDGTFTLAASPAGMVTADATAGGVTPAPELVTNGTFDSDIAGWNTTGSGTWYITWYSGYSGSMRQYGYGAGYSMAYQNLSMEAGKNYTIKIRLEATLSYGYLYLRVNGSNVGSNMTTAGEYTIEYTAPVTGTLRLDIIYQRASVNTWQYCYIDDVSVKGPDIVQDQYASDLLTDLLTDHAPSTAVPFNSSDAAALPSYHCGRWTDGGDSYADIIHQLAASLGLLWWLDSSGVLRFKQLTAPAAGGLEIGETQIAGDIERYFDPADGLSGNMGVSRNHYVYDRANLAGVLSDEAADALSNPWQTRVSSAVTLHAAYQRRQNADPIDSLLHKSADAQAEIDRQCTLYTVRRYFYTLTVLDAAAADLQPGDSVHLTHPRHGLSAGKNLLVVSVTGKYLGPETKLTLWG